MQHGSTAFFGHFNLQPGPFLLSKNSSRGLLIFNKRGKNSFINVGFDNWKKVKERFREHEMSHLQNEALMKLKSLNNPSVAVRLSTQLVIDQKYRREMLMKELSSINT